MVLRVAVENGLGDIRRSLVDAGYEVVSLEEFDTPVDAIIYSGVSNDLTGFDAIDYFGDAATMGVNSPSGVLMLNAQGFSTGEVVSLVNSNLNGMGDQF